MSTRSLYGFGFLLSITLLSVSLYLQFFDGVIPCPLCTLQRLVFVLIAFILLIGTLFHNKASLRLSVNMLLTVTSFLGLLLAGRQIKLQHAPEMNTADCGVSLQYMIEVLPWQEVLQKIFSGSAECTQRGFEWLSLNMAEWALIGFTIFLMLSFYLFYSAFKRKA